MISLLYRIAGDINPFKSALRDGEKAAGKSGSQMGRLMSEQMKASVMRYIGAGAVLGTLTKAVEEAKTITNGAAQTGVSTDAWQEMKIAADEAGISIDELQARIKEAPKEWIAAAQKIRETGRIIPEDDIRALSQANEELENLKATAIKASGGLWGWAKDKAEQLTYGAYDVSGRIAGGIGAVTGWNRMKSAGSWLRNTADIGLTNMELGVNGTSAGETSLQRFNRVGKQAVESNQWWESIGGNEDWSLQSRQVAARQIAEDIKEQTRIAGENLNALKELRNDMRNL